MINNPDSKSMHSCINDPQHNLAVPKRKTCLLLCVRIHISARFWSLMQQHLLSMTQRDLNL